MNDKPASWPPPSEVPKTQVLHRAQPGGGPPPLQRPPPQPQQSPPPGPAPGDATIYRSDPERTQGPVVGVLVGLKGELQGKVYGLFDGDNKLGRSEECQAVLRSGRISREHALVIHQDGHFAIKPLSERNPTIVNDVRVEGVELRDGDYLKLGDDTFRFRSV